jgi:hypothetical protein
MLSHHCPNLRSLVMERVYYHVEDTDLRITLVDQRREWKGVNGVLSGLTSLISEMTTQMVTIASRTVNRNMLTRSQQAQK